MCVSSDPVAQLYLSGFFPKNSQLVCAEIWDVPKNLQHRDKGSVWHLIQLLRCPVDVVQFQFFYQLGGRH